MKFKDHFSEASDDYNQFRPTYPKSLFKYLLTLCDETHLAWDCATGNGQAAVALAENYSAVIATDASKNQIDNAMPNPKIHYCVEAAEKTSITSHSVNLVTVAQALHWFDLGAFANELVRVLKPRGVLAAWTYDLLSINPALDVLINQLNSQTLQNYWPPERKYVSNAYNNIHFMPPLIPIETITIPMNATWSFDELYGYLHTWSAVKRYHKMTGTNPLDEIQRQLITAWGELTRQLTIEWPLTVKTWRNMP